MSISTNIPETLDKLLAIYAKVSFDLMQEFPEAHGIHFFIREDGDYSAIPAAKVPPGYADGYSDPKFEARAATLLKELVPATEAIRDASSVVDCVERFGIHVRRDTASNQIRLRATVDTNHGYLFSYRDAHFNSKRPIFFAASPAVMCLTVTGEAEGHSEIIKSAAEGGIEPLFEAVIEHGLMMDLKDKASAWKSMSRRWKAAFPTDGSVQLEPISHLFQCYVVSNRENGLIILHEDAPENAAIAGIPNLEIMHFDSVIRELAQTISTPQL